MENPFEGMGIDPLAGLDPEDVLAIGIRIDPETGNLEIGVFLKDPTENGTDLAAEAASILADADKNGGQS